MWILFVAYLVMLVYFLFFSEGFGRTENTAEYRYNLELFKEITRFTRYRDILGWKAFFINVFGNVLAFMPLGFFIPALGNLRKNGLLVVLICFSLSLLVEVIQLVYKLGCFDVDDLLLNTLGGLLGYMVCLLLHKITEKRKGRKG